MSKEQRKGLNVAMLCSSMKRSPTSLLFSIDVRPTLEQELGYLEVTSGDSTVQGLKFHGIMRHGIDLCPAPDKQLDCFLLPEERREMEDRKAIWRKSSNQGCVGVKQLGNARGLTWKHSRLENVEDGLVTQNQVRNALLPKVTCLCDERDTVLVASTRKGRIQRK
jgi:hypothetical protein